MYTYLNWKLYYFLLPAFFAVGLAVSFFLVSFFESSSLAALAFVGFSFVVFALLAAFSAFLADDGFVAAFFFGSWSVFFLEVVACFAFFTFIGAPTELLLLALAFSFDFKLADFLRTGAPASSFDFALGFEVAFFEVSFFFTSFFGLGLALALAFFNISKPLSPNL